MMEAFIVCAILLAIIVLPYIAYLRIAKSAREEVITAPKIPMYLCDVHGCFPAKHCLQIVVPVLDDTQQPLAVDMCPFCYDEKMRVAEKVFKHEKQGSRPPN